MHTIIEDVKKLPVEERANLFLALKSDTEVTEFLDSANGDKILLQELSNRDKAYADGKLTLTTIEDLSTRLKAKRDAL